MNALNRLTAPLTPVEQALWHLDGPDGADRRFRHPFFQTLPPRLARPIGQTYSAIYVNEGRRAANLRLLDLEALRKASPVPFDASDGDIRRLAKRRADLCWDVLIHHAKRKRRAYEAASAIAQSWGVKPPKVQIT